MQHRQNDCSFFYFSLLFSPWCYIVNEFEFDAKIDNVNFFEMIEFIEDSRLVNKLHGFVDKHSSVKNKIGNRTFFLFVTGVLCGFSNQNLFFFHFWKRMGLLWSNQEMMKNLCRAMCLPWGKKSIFFILEHKNGKKWKGWLSEACVHKNRRMVGKKVLILKNSKCHTFRNKQEVSRSVRCTIKQ